MFHSMLAASALLFGTAASAAETNLLTLGAGAVVVRADPTAEVAANVALDGSTQTLGVGIPRREPLPLSFVIELPARTTLHRVGSEDFNEYGSAKGRHIKTFRVEGSRLGPDEGFSEMVTVTLQEGREGPQLWDVPEPRSVRWLRVTLLDTHTPAERDVQPHNFTELLGYGEQEAIPSDQERFTGTWRLRRKGLNDEPGVNVIELKQEGSMISGCQMFGGQFSTISGSVEGGLARLVATTDLGATTPLTANLTSDGQLAGVSFGGPARPFWAAFDLKAPSACSEPPPDNPVLSALEAGNVAVLHGIHFDVDSDKLRSDAKPALEQLLAALQASPALKVRIEGHTDSDGTDSHNLELSERRAKAVVAWLTQREVSAARLEAVGKGETAPLAANDTSSGRALNRRVEIHPLK